MLMAEQNQLAYWMVLLVVSPLICISQAFSHFPSVSWKMHAVGSRALEFIPDACLLTSKHLCTTSAAGGGGGAQRAACGLTYFF
jgi:hypothetical protein